MEKAALSGRPFLHRGRGVTLEAKLQQYVGRFAAMRALAARAVKESPDDVRARFGAGIAYRITLDNQAALAEFQRCCELEPGNTHYLYERGVTQEYLGQFDAAAQSYAAALQAVPENYKARYALTALRKQSVLSNSIPELEREFAMGDDADGWRSLHLGHALAKSYEDLGELEKAFAWLGLAKRRRRERHPFLIAREAATASAALSVQPQAGEGCETTEPIFVTGLPRSGTTLVDRILSSHPDVTSAGEMNNFLHLLKMMSGSTTPASLDDDMLSRASSVDFVKLGRAYVDSTRPVTGAAPRFVDKAPSNYFLAPLILRALPNARVICLRRHPLDSCLSNYKQIFPFDDRYHDYVYDLTSTAQKFVQFDRVISHWRRTLPPERFMVLQYEDLVTNQEARTRELLAFCGLAWDDRCIAFHENAAGVATPSARQVRTAMYTSAMGRWAKYGALLDPARRVLEQAGIALD
jgi:tetratricopeptide (TPR) repeat protein